MYGLKVLETGNQLTRNIQSKIMAMQLH